MYQTKKFSDKTLTLNHGEEIAHGTIRRVFIHPDNPDLCIKIYAEDFVTAQAAGKSKLYRALRPQYANRKWRDENIMEARAYATQLNHAPASIWKHLPRLFGWQETTLGAGLVYDFYRDKDANPAPTLAALLKQDGATPTLAAAIDELTAALTKTKLWLRAPRPANIVFAADEKLKLIDCLGAGNAYLRHLPLYQNLRQQNQLHRLRKLIKAQQ